MTANKRKLVLFASGSGTNVQAIVNYFRKSNQIEIVHLFCNREKAGVLEIAEKENIPTTLITDKKEFRQGLWLSKKLCDLKPDLIVLAGFLWKIPENIINSFHHKIINIHPALLPAYGGKGMYGQRVHEAVIADRQKESGITIHYVDEQYDEGQIIIQITCPVHEDDTVEKLSQRVQKLEHAQYPLTIERLLLG